MPYWCAAFGPNNSYLFHSPHKSSIYNLPDRINSLFNTEPRATAIHDIALGPNGSYAIIFTDYTGIKVRHFGLPQPVEQWLLDHSRRALNPSRDLATMQISLGPNNSYFAFDKYGCIWGNLPPGLNAAINQRRDSNGCFKPGAFPYLVSLGARGTYAMITTGGGGTWYFGGQNQQLDQYLNSMGSLMHVGVILSPFDDKHFLLVTGTGVTASVCPDVCTAAYSAFADDWRSSVEAETMPPPPPGPPPQTESHAQHPPRRRSSIAADVETKHNYIPYTPVSEHRPSLPLPLSNDTTAHTLNNVPLYSPYIPSLQAAAQFPPRPSPNSTSPATPAQYAPYISPAVQGRPVSSKGLENPYTLSTNVPPANVLPTFPPPPPYCPNPNTAPPQDIKMHFPPPPTTQSHTPIPQLPPTPAPTPVQTAQAEQPRAAAVTQTKTQDKAKWDQRINTGLKVGKMAVQGLSIGVSLMNIASGNQGSVPSFDFGDAGPGDVPVDVPVPVPDVQVPDTSSFWQPLQDTASMPIQGQDNALALQGQENAMALI